MKKIFGVLTSMAMALALLVMPVRAEDPVAVIGEQSYNSLSAAIMAVPEGLETSTTITLVNDAVGGVIVEKNKLKNIVLDLNGYTYDVKQAVGSTGTETNGMQLNKGNKVVIKNGTMKSSTSSVKIMIKNYADLTLENVVVKGSVNNCGKLVVNGDKTVITSGDEWAITTGNYHKDDIITTEINGGKIDSVACETPLWETGSATVNESVTTIINGGEIGKIGAYDWRLKYGGNYLTAPLLENWHFIVNENAVVKSNEFSIKAGNEYFESLDRAVNEVGGDIVLLKDVKENVTVPADKTVVLDLNGKTLTIPNDCGLKVSGKLTVNSSVEGGKITANDTPIYVDGNTGLLTLNSGLVESENDYGIFVVNDGSVIVNGGSVTSKYSALSGNNTTGNMNFEVNGGVLTAKQGPAIYMPNQLNLTITNGTLNGGVSVRMGTINISGGTLNAIKENIDSPKEYYSYSGNAWLPDALYVFGGTYPSDSGNDLKLTITGGEFVCENGQGSAVAIYDLGKVEQKMNVNISDKAVLKTNSSNRKAYQVLNLEDIGVTNPKTGYNNPDYVGKVVSQITGGTFSNDVSAYVANGYKSYKVSDTEYQVAPVATAVKLDKNELTLNLKDKTTATLIATVDPSNTLDTVTWSTSDPKVATVENGKVTAVAEGTATIKATVNGKEATCTVTVLGNRTVTFDNEGTKTTATVVKGEKVAEPTKPTKEGYTFAGWYNGTEKYDFTKPVTDNLTLTAKWTINTYTVTFSDGVTAQKVEHGKLVAEPTTPTKDGYTFVGWYNGKEKYDFTKPVTKDLTLTAEWKVVPGKEEVEVPTIDPKEPVEEVTIGVANQGKTETILTESIKDETLKEAIEEKIADGIDVNTVVNVDLVKPEETSEEVKKDIEKVIAAAKENNVEVAQYLDINIKVMAGDEELGKITTTTEKLTFQVAVPEELKKEGRTFIVIRVHDGKVEELKTVEKDGMLIFETDKFSTYALTYKDVEPTKPATKPTTPNTSDMSMIAGFGIMAILSGMILVVLKKKESLR